MDKCIYCDEYHQSEELCLKKYKCNVCKNKKHIQEFNIIDFQEIWNICKSCEKDKIEYKKRKLAHIDKTVNNGGKIE